jgi:putative ABC transport system permease protein
MMIGAILSEAWRAMAVNRLRTLLTMLGVIIGVGAVVMMLAVGQGAQTHVKESISSMGANLFMVLSGTSTSGGLRLGAGTAPSLTLADAEAIAELPVVAAVAPALPGTEQLVYGPNNWSTLVYGTTPSYLQVAAWPLDSGQPFTDSDVRSAARIVLLGQTVVDNLFGTEDPVGKTLRIKNSPYIVVGVLAPKGQSLEGRDQDDRVVIPLTTAQRKLFGTPRPGSVRFIMVQVKSAELMERAQDDIETALRQRRRLSEDEDDNFTVRNLTAIAETAAVTARVFSGMLGAIASISLVVGGIGIMNIMLVSVTERTREIGIRMAIGARRRDILVQFLLEALIISVVGCLLGVAIGVGGAWLVSTLTETVVVVTLWSVALAFGVAAAIGIFFGLYPSRKAAALRPIEALRYE